MLPESVKDMWMWPALFRTYMQRPLEFYFRLCEMVLKLELKGKVVVGTTLAGIHCMICCLRGKQKEVIKVVCHNEKQLLHLFKFCTYVAQHVHPIHLASRLSIVYRLFDSIHKQVIEAMFRSCTWDSYTSYVSLLVELAEALNTAADKCNVKRYGTAMIHLYNFMAKHYNYVSLRLEDKNKFKIVMQAYSFLLNREDPSYQRRSNW